MIVPFSNKDAYTSKFEDAQTRIWRSFNDDQHMWVCGSFFQFSAGEGWENLRGFDISPEGSKKLDDAGPLSFLKGGANTNLYVVQADRAMQAEEIDPADPEQSFRSKMWMLPVMENRDKILVAPRLRRTYELVPNSEFLARQVDYLPAVYESLIKMDQFAFTFNMQAQLAVNLVADPDFCANEEQINALKQGQWSSFSNICYVVYSWFLTPSLQVLVCDRLPRNSGSQLANLQAQWMEKIKSTYLHTLSLDSEAATRRKNQRLAPSFQA